MAVPDFQSLMLPLLRSAADGQVHSMAEARDLLAAEFNLSDDDRSELLPSARAKRYDNRVAWAKVHLTRAGLLDSPKAGLFRINGRGREVLSQGLERIDLRFLAQFPEYRSWRSKTTTRPSKLEPDDENGQETPEERLEHAFELFAPRLP